MWTRAAQATAGVATVRKGGRRCWQDLCAIGGLLSARIFPEEEVSVREHHREGLRPVALATLRLSSSEFSWQLLFSP